MFKLVKYLSILLFIVFLFTRNTSAITPIPTQFMNIPQPGVSCGNASSSDYEVTKCCKTPIYSPEMITKQFIDSAPTFAKVIAGILGEEINKKAEIVNFTQRGVSIQPCVDGTPSTPGDTNNTSCICIKNATPSPLSAMRPICSSINPKTNEKNQCEKCADGGGYWSSLGCFSGNVSEFITQKILGTGVGIAGGISLLCIMFAAFQMQTSSGNAEKIKKAQELLTNCITGLMVIIFSVLILKIIGVDILRLPNFIK